MISIHSLWFDLVEVRDLVGLEVQRVLELHEGLGALVLAPGPVGRVFARPLLPDDVRHRCRGALPRRFAAAAAAAASACGWGAARS